jgi:ferredoxin
VAKDIAAGLGDAKIVPIAGALKTGTDASYDIVGIVYPVYMFGLPLIVAEFLKKVVIKQGAYVFCAATLGGLPGRAHTLSRNILRGRGIDMACGFSVQMPGNYAPLYGAELKERQDEIFLREKQKVKDISRLVRLQQRGIMEEKPVWLNFLLNVLFYRGGSARIPMAAKDFWITDACTKCGICAQVCPVENIRMQDGKPAWLDHCQHCLACLQWCPVEAIQYKKSTLGKKRYHHPDVSANDIMSQR